MSPDSFLARALLASGMLTRAQLEIALKWLEEAPQGGLGDLLCTNGVIPRALYEALMRFYKKDTTRVAPATGNRDKGIREAQLFCLVAVREKEVTVEQLRDAVDQWVRLEGMGKPRPIGDVMMEKGYLDLIRSRAMMEKTKESTLACSSCGEVDFLYKVTGAPFTCDRCRQPLVPTRVKGGAPSAPSDAMVGKTFGGCRLDEKIGAGRWTVVYKGLIPSQNRPAVVKLFSADTPAGALERYVVNARKAIPLSHAGLVAVIDAGVTDGRGWIVMEHVADGRVWPAREKMNWNRLCKVGIELSRALAVIHANGLVHGDVRPSSVFVRESGAKLSDFGQAHDGTLGVPCDPLVTAPELWKSEPFDNKADLYALGVTLYCFAAGRPPFEETDPRLLEMAHRSTVPKPPGAWNLELPRALSAIITKLLEKDPATRYGFAEEVARDFEAVLRGETPAAAGSQEGRTCQFCKTPNPATEQKCIVCGKPLSSSAEKLLLDSEFLCPKCERPIDEDTVACHCGYRPCKKCHKNDSDPETGYCNECMSPEAQAEMKRKKAQQDRFRKKPTLGARPGGPASGVLKPPPPPSGVRLKPPPPKTGSSVPAVAGLKPAPPQAGSKPPALKPPPPKVGGPSLSDDELDFDNLPPPADDDAGADPIFEGPPAQAAPPAAAADDLDFDALPPPPAKSSNDDLLGDDPPPRKPPPGPPPKPKGLMDRHRRR